MFSHINGGPIHYQALHYWLSNGLTVESGVPISYPLFCTASVLHTYSEAYVNFENIYNAHVSHMAYMERIEAWNNYLNNSP